MLSDDPVFTLFFAQSLFAIFLGTTFFSFYDKYERGYLLLWAWSWWSLGVYWVSTAVASYLLWEGLPAGHPVRIGASTLAGVAGYAHVVLLFAGAYRVSTGKSISGKRLAAFLLGFGLLGAALSLGSLSTTPWLRRLLRLGLRSAVASGAYLGAALALVRSARGPTGRRLVAVSFALIGLAHALGAVVSFGEALPPAMAQVLNQRSTVFDLIVADLLLQVVMGFGLVIWLLQQEHAEHLATQEQLRQTQKLEALGLLAGGIAHDFNNYLTAILGYSELAGSRLAPTEPGYKDVREIRSAANRASSLTRQLLTFSRKQVLQTRVLDVNEVVSSSAALLRRLISESIRVSLDVEDTPVLVRADPSQLEQVCVNLALNARDAMPGGGSLAIGVDTVDLATPLPARDSTIPPGRYARISVCDSGTGMAPETLARIFEPFFSTKPRESSTGLGLATVYGIVHRSEGHILVMTEEGVGTRVTVYLPRVEGVLEEPAEETPTIVERRGKRLLLVEDDRAVRDVALKALSSSGYDIVSASNGKEALELARRDERGFDVLVTDLVLPEMGGRPLAEALRREHEDLKVLYVSGYAAEAIDLSADERDVAFLPKPFTAAGLQEAVARLLAPQSQRSVSRSTG